MPTANILSTYVDAVDAAREAGLGLWRGDFEPPWEWLKQHPRGRRNDIERTGRHRVVRGQPVGLVADYERTRHDLGNPLPAHAQVNRHAKNNGLPSAELLPKAQEPIGSWWQDAFATAPLRTLPDLISRRRMRACRGWLKLCISHPWATWLLR